MENKRARRRSETHRLPEAREVAEPEWVAFEELREARTPDEEWVGGAYERMMDAESLLYQRWEQANGSDELNGDPVGLLLSLPIKPEENDGMLWLLGLGEKVAALGGHVEVHAVFDDETLGLIREPGFDDQPPIVPDASELPRDPNAPKGDPVWLADGRVRVGLTQDERGFLVLGLGAMATADRPSEAIVSVIGVGDLEDFAVTLDRLALAIERAEPLHPRDWQRALVALEMAFVSSAYGADWDWEDRTGWDDDVAILILRALQGKISRVAGQVQ